MTGWAVTFLIIAVAAGLFAISGLAGAGSSFAWVLFIIGLLLAILSFIGDSKHPKASAAYRPETANSETANGTESGLNKEDHHTDTTRER